MSKWRCVVGHWSFRTVEADALRNWISNQTFDSCLSQSYLTLTAGPPGTLFIITNPPGPATPPQDPLSFPPT